MNQPQPHEFPEWALKYIHLVKDNVIDLLEAQVSAFPISISNFADKADYAYAPGKWTVKEMIGHIIDTERILVYRLLAFARGEQANLPGFNEDNYVKTAHFKDISLQNLADEFVALRKANLFLIKSLNETELNRSGNANNMQISVRASVWVLAGHVEHHLKILNERYA